MRSTRFGGMGFTTDNFNHLERRVSVFYGRYPTNLMGTKSKFSASGHVANSIVNVFLNIPSAL